MILNEYTECMARIMYDGEAAIQKIQLADYNNIIDRLPKGSRIKLLCSNEDTFKWVEVESVECLDQSSLYDVYEEDKLGLEIICNKNIDIDIPVIPRKTWDVNRCTYASFLLGLAPFSKFDDYRIKWHNNGKESSYTIKSFLGNRKKLKGVAPNLYSPSGVPMFIHAMLHTLGVYIADILNPNPIDVDYLGKYYIKTLIYSWICTPIILQKNLQLDLDIENSGFLSGYVPLQMNPILYLLEGDTCDIKSRILVGKDITDFNIKNIKLNKLKSKRVYKNIRLKLESDYNPIMMCSGIPIRWSNE